MKYSIALAASILSLAASCPPNPNPKPTPTPTPTPNPIPEAGVGVKPEMLLRVNGTNVLGEPVFMAIQCCTATPLGAKDSRPPYRKPKPLTLNGLEINSRWPLISKPVMDFFHSYHANMFAFRINAWKGELETEWSDIGGPFNPDLTPNPRFWQEARDLTNYAASINSRVEVTFDTWYCKWAQWGEPYLYLSPEDIASCGIKASPQIEAIWRYTIKQLGCFGNTIFSVDNEGGEIQGSKRDWYLWMHYLVHDEQEKSPCLMPDGSKIPFVHMVGTNTEFAYDGPFDYVTTHSRGPLTNPLAGKFTINNERNPAFTPDEEAGYFEQARKINQSWAFWADDMSEVDYKRTLELFRGIVEGSSAGCVAPPPDDPKWVGVVDDSRIPQTLSWLNAAKAIVGDPTKLPGATVWDRGLLALELVAKELRKQGHCAGGPWADANVIQAPDGRWEEMHTIAFTDGNWSGDPFRNKNQWSYPVNYSVEQCPGNPPATAYIYCKPFGPWEDGTRWDCTPQTKRVNGGSPVWPEGNDRAACEIKSMGGNPTISISNMVGSLNFTQRTANPLQFILRGSGTATLNCNAPATKPIELCGYTVNN